jgi:hypothetical protein
MTDTQTQKGWIFPAGLEIPEQHWYRIDFGGDVMHDLNREGHVYLARQHGMIGLNSEVAASGTMDGIHHAAVEATLEVVRDGDVETYTAIGGADTASQQVRDPEHVFSVAESRAVKRAVKRALGIRSAEADVSSDPAERSTSAPGGMDSDTPASEQFDDPTGGEAEQTTDKTNDNDDSITW